MAHFHTSYDIYMHMYHSPSLPMHKFAVTFTYSADNFVSLIPSSKYFHGHIAVARDMNIIITSLRGIVGVNAKQVAAKQHH